MTRVSIWLNNDEGSWQPVALQGSARLSDAGICELDQKLRGLSVVITQLSHPVVGSIGALLVGGGCASCGPEWRWPGRWSSRATPCRST